MNNITINYGGNSAQLNVADGTTVSALLSNRNYQAVFGFTGSEDALIDGAPVSGGTILTNGDVVTLVTKPATKA